MEQILSELEDEWMSILLKLEDQIAGLEAATQEAALQKQHIEKVKLLEAQVQKKI